MLCTAKTNTLSAESNSLLSVSGSVGICANLKSSYSVCPAHECFKIAGDISLLSRKSALVNVTCGTVKGDNIAFLECLYGVATCNCEVLFILVNLYLVTAGNAASAHTAGNNGSVGGHTASCCHDTLSSVHAFNVLRRCFLSYKNNLFAFFSGCNSLISCEVYLTCASARRCGKSLCQRCSLLKSVSLECRVQKSVKLFRVYLQKSLLLGDFALVYKVNGDLKSSSCCSLTVSCLEHIELAILNGVLHILHIFVVILKSLSDLGKLLEYLRHILLELSYRGRSSYACNNVLALCVY